MDVVNESFLEKGFRTMSIKVAVASKDGKYIHRHFGHAEQFLIFEIAGGKADLLEIRSADPPCSCQSHDEGRLAISIDVIADCRAVLASQIGPGAAYALQARGIKPYVTRDFIADALQELISSEEFTNDFTKEE
jgi:nitrogen fixation protein NifX